MEHIMSANEAQALSAKNDPNFVIELKKIGSDIKDACDSGSYSVTVSGRISEGTKLYLSQSGYSLRFNNNLTTISWGYVPKKEERMAIL